MSVKNFFIQKKYYYTNIIKEKIKKIYNKEFF